MRVTLFVIIAAAFALAQYPSAKSAGKKPTTPEAPGKLSKAADVGGWGKVKWGMTTAQVKTLYPGILQASDEAKEDAEYVGRLSAKNFAIGHLEMNLSVESRAGSDRISRIAFELPEGTRATPGAAFTDLHNALTVKYGPPTHESREEGSKTISHTSTWNFRSTTIDLLWIEVTGIHFNIVQLLYTGADKKAQDAL